MVGNIQRKTAVSDDGVNYYGIYWFGGLPSKLQMIQKDHQNFFLKVSEFFKDPISAENTHRTFIRKTVRGWGGTPCLKSYVMEYDNDIERVTDEQTRLMAQEMVHNWVHMDPMDSGDDNSWFTNGFANLYSVYLPFRLQFRTNEYFKGTVNSHFMNYYTNPYINDKISNVEGVKLKDNNPLIASLVGLRGFVAVFKNDVHVRVAAGNNDAHKIDLVLYRFLERRKNGESCAVNAWLELLTKEYGQRAIDEYTSMAAGEVVLPPDGFFGKKHNNTNVQQEMMEYGLDLNSFEKRVVSGLRKGSRAAEAGLRNGDKIVWNSYDWQCAGDIDRKMEVVVERHKEQIRLEWWPRSCAKVSSWQVLPVVEQ